MAREDSRGFFRVSPVDQLGRRIDPIVLAAAEEVFPRALEHAMKFLGDPALVANALEEVAATVSRVLRTRADAGGSVHVHNLPGYVFRAFVRLVNRLKRRQPVVVSLAEADQTRAWADPSRQFEMKILVDECLSRCDFVSQDMFWRRIQGCPGRVSAEFMKCPRMRRKQDLVTPCNRHGKDSGFEINLKY